MIFKKILEKINQTDQEEKKRIFEMLASVLVLFALYNLSRLETRLFSMSEEFSENREFFVTLGYFALININVILILLLGFLLFRNITKLIVERKRGFFGSNLKTKLVLSFTFFSLAPAILLFYISTRYMASNFESWFSDKVQIVMRQTREVGSLLYKQDQKRLQSLARLAAQKVSFIGLSEIPFSAESNLSFRGLNGFDVDYGLNYVKIYSPKGKLLWASQYTDRSQSKSDDLIQNEADVSLKYFLQIYPLFLKNPRFNSHSSVVGEKDQDVVMGAVPLLSPWSERLLGCLITEVHFESQILKSVEQILSDFEQLKPQAKLIRLSYTILMVLVLFLIGFTAIWLGFYIAKKMTKPLQDLAEATQEIAHGNYHVVLEPHYHDETGQLVHSFNKMTEDLRAHIKSIEEGKTQLQGANEEISRKRQYLEIVLRHITAGVISIDSDLKVTSVNAAAEVLLGVSASFMLGRSIQSGLGEELTAIFWNPIHEGLDKSSSFQGQVNLLPLGKELSLIVSGLPLKDDKGLELGLILIFDDAFEKIKAQRVIAWKEVAQRIAHEIKNPLTPIKLNAQRLIRRFHDQFEREDLEVFKGCMETIIAQVDVLRGLVNEFTKFSRLPAIRPKPYDLESILNEVISFFSMSYPDLEFKRGGSWNLPILQLDPGQMKGALINIVTNAIESLEEKRKGTILFKADYLEDIQTIHLEISDNGCGIPKELKERVLEPYFSTKDEGTGLGLAIVHQIITDHGGYLRMTENQPCGTTVVIELPSHARSSVS
ncbi:MAG: HAMP domain-containing protein [Oligoflexales bacterium]|nr:HAMP domain-containing protein [Oligoflexales bacterium]